MFWARKLWQLSVCLASIAASAAIQSAAREAVGKSAGCSSQTPSGRFQLPSGQERGLFEFDVSWFEEGLPQVKRRVSIYLPTGYHPENDTALPVVFIFAGWGDKAYDYHSLFHFRKLADLDNFIVVYPEGLDDCEPGAWCQGYYSWNAVGSAGSINDGRQSCDPGNQPHDYCYSSVKARKGYCHKCDWTTGYDDAAFIGQTVDELGTSFCVDTERIFAWGCSNGGLMTHELAQKLPGTFAGIAAGCGGKPHEGWQLDLPAGSPPISVLLISGDRDRTIPLETPPPGTWWWDGYYFANVTSTVRAYLDYNGCANTTPRAFEMPFRGANMKCVEEGNDCLAGARVVTCIFEGGHDVNTELGGDDLQEEPQLAWSFFKGDVWTKPPDDGGGFCAQPLLALMVVLSAGFLHNFAGVL